MQTPPINHRVTLEWLYGFVGWKACVDAWPLWISSSLLEEGKWLTQSWLTINTQPWINKGGHHTMAARHLREQARVQLVRALPHRTHPISTYIIHPSFKCLLCCSITPPPAQCGQWHSDYQSLNEKWNECAMLCQGKNGMAIGLSKMEAVEEGERQSKGWVHHSGDHWQDHEKRQHFETFRKCIKLHFGI